MTYIVKIVRDVNWYNWDYCPVGSEVRAYYIDSNEIGIMSGWWAFPIRNIELIVNTDNINGKFIATNNGIRVLDKFGEPTGWSNYFDIPKEMTLTPITFELEYI